MRFTTLSNYYLISWWCGVDFRLFVCWFGFRFCYSYLTWEINGLELASSIIFVLQANRLTKCASLDFKKYAEFCSIYGFKHLIKGPTRTTCSTTTVIDHILTNTKEYILQSHFLIVLAVLNHSPIYCNRKIWRAKYNKLKEITFRSPEIYSVDVYKENLEQLWIPYYDSFDNFDLGYSNFISRLESVINVVAPVKTVRIKSNSREWFDGEIPQEINKRDKLYKKFKLTKLHDDKDIYMYREARNANTANLKKLCETLKNLVCKITVHLPPIFVLNWKRV